MQSPFYRAMGGLYRGKLVGIWEKLFLHIFQKLERDLAIPHRSWQTDGNLPCGWARAISQTKHLVRTDDGVEDARSVRRLAEHSWSEENLRSVVETPRNPRSMTTDDASDPRVVPEAHEKQSPNEEANENDDESGETPDKPEDDDHDMQGGGMLTELDTTTTISSGRGEKRPETQENVFAKKRVTMKSPKRPITPVPPSEDPVKRGLMKKTDLKNDNSVMNIDTDLLNVVNTLTNDETESVTNLDEDCELPRMRTILDDPKK